MYMVLDHAKVKYVDNRVTLEEYAAMKEAGTAHGIPSWEENGVHFDESKALLRYLATTNGYYPKDALTAYKADKVIDYFNSLLETWIPQFFKPESVDQQKFKEMMEMVAGRICEDLQQHGKPYMCGDKISVADFTAFGILATWLLNDKFAFKSYVDAGRDEMMQKFPLFAAWMMLMKKENADHLAKSPDAAF